MLSFRVTPVGSVRTFSMMHPVVRLGKVDILSGVSSFFGGFGFIVVTPSAWGWALVPMAVAGVLFVGTGSLGVWGATALYHHVVAGTDGTLGAIGAGVLYVLLLAVALVLAFVVACGLAQPLSGFALEALAKKQERALGQEPRTVTESFSTSFFRSLRVTLLSLACGLPVLAVLTLITVLFPPAAVVTVPLKFLVVSLMVAWDFLDYPLGVRGARVRDRLDFMGNNLGSVFVFGLLSALVLLIPGVGFIVLPAGVCGATRLLVRAERAEREHPALPR
jgi:CysZ protein